MYHATPRSASLPSPRRRSVTAALLLPLLAAMAACTTTTSSKLTSQIAPVQRVWVVVSLGSFGSFDPALSAARRPGAEVSNTVRATFADTLQRNGLPVSGYVQLAHPLQNVASLSALWAENKGSLAPTSHALVLTAQRLRAGRVEYEAVLWDTASESLVWKGAPSSLADRARRATEGTVLAGDLLRAFQRDQLLVLPNGHPIDANGAEIPLEWVPIRLY